jgi:hypothetical protein
MYFTNLPPTGLPVRSRRASMLTPLGDLFV